MKAVFAILAVLIIIASAFVVAIHNGSSSNNDEEHFPDNPGPNIPDVPEDAGFLSAPAEYDNCESIILQEVKNTLEMGGYYVSLGYLKSVDTYGLLAIPSDSSCYEIKKDDQIVERDNNDLNLEEMQSFHEAGSISTMSVGTTSDDDAIEKGIKLNSVYAESTFIGFDVITPRYCIEDLIIEDVYAKNSSLVPVYVFDLSDIEGQFVNNGQFVQYSVNNSVIYYSAEEIPFDRYVDSNNFENYVESAYDGKSNLYDYDIRSLIFGNSSVEFTLESAFNDIDYDALIAEINDRINNQKSHVKFIIEDIPEYCIQLVNAYVASISDSYYMGIKLSDLEEKFNNLKENEYLVIEDGEFVPHLQLDPPVVPSTKYKVIVGIASGILFVTATVLAFATGGVPALLLGGAIVGAAIDTAVQVCVNDRFLYDLDITELIVSTVASSMSFILPGLVSQPLAIIGDSLISGITDCTLTVLQGSNFCDGFNAFVAGVTIGALFNVIGESVHFLKKLPTDIRKNSNWDLLDSIQDKSYVPVNNKIIQHYNVLKIEQKLNAFKSKNLKNIENIELNGYSVKLQTEEMTPDNIVKYPELKNGMKYIVVDGFPVADYSDYAKKLHGIDAIGEIRFVNVGSRNTTEDIVATGILDEDLALQRTAKEKGLSEAWFSTNYDQAYTDMSFHLGITKKDLIDLKKVSGSSEEKRLKVIDCVIKHSPQLTRNDLLQFTNEKLILHEQFLIIDNRLVGVGVLVPKSVHDYSHLGLNAYSRYTSSKMEVVETAFAPNGDYITRWEATNINGTSDGILRIDNINCHSEVMIEKIYYRDGTQQYKVIGKFNVVSKTNSESEGQMMTMTIDLPDEASADTFYQYYSMGANNLSCNLESSLPNIVMRGTVEKNGHTMEYIIDIS